MRRSTVPVVSAALVGVLRDAGGDGLFGQVVVRAVGADRANVHLGAPARFACRMVPVGGDGHSDAGGDPPAQGDGEPASEVPGVVVPQRRPRVVVGGRVQGRAQERWGSRVVGAAPAHTLVGRLRTGPNDTAASSNSRTRHPLQGQRVEQEPQAVHPDEDSR